jgi:hypothetical protein
MANDLVNFPLAAVKLNELSTKSILDGNEVLQVVDGSTNRKTTVENISEYIEEQAKGLAQYYMISNSTATTISAIDTFYKIAGTTLQGAAPSNFILADNKATFTGNNTTNFKVTAILSLTSGNNQDIHIQIAKNGIVQARSNQEILTGGSGQAQNLVVKDIFTLATNDYIEIFTANKTSATNVTVVNLNVIIEKLH